MSNQTPRVFKTLGVYRNIVLLFFNVHNRSLFVIQALELWQQQARYAGTLQNVTHEGCFCSRLTLNPSPRGRGTLRRNLFIMRATIPCSLFVIQALQLWQHGIR